MQRYKIVLDYDGSNYSGWQIQPGAVQTIQGTVQAALQKLSANQVVELVGCGRTDAGVHAKSYVAHTDLALRDDVGPELILFKLNRMLPADIVVHGLVEMNSNFHARYDAVSRSYVYRLHTSKDVWSNRFSTYYPYRSTDIVLTTLQAAARLLIGEHDFTAFCKVGSDVAHHRCHVTAASWQQQDDHNYEFTITANRFLRGMIRLVVGMCCNVSRGQLPLREVETALANADRLSLDWSMPPHGLTLSDIVYEE